MMTQLDTPEPLVLKASGFRMADAVGLEAKSGIRRDKFFIWRGTSLGPPIAGRTASPG